MTAKPESVESVVDVVSLLECDYLGQGAARTHRKDCRKCRVWTAYRAEMAEALKEPTAEEISLMATTLKECLRIELDGKQGPLQPGDWSAEGGVIDLDRVARAVFVVARAAASMGWTNEQADT